MLQAGRTSAQWPNILDSIGSNHIAASHTAGNCWFAGHTANSCFGRNPHFDNSFVASSR